jgi:replicative DNA helicase
LSRGAEHGEQPKLGHLRESGEIEHAADVVLFLWQPVRDSNIVRLYVAKQRNGPKEIVIDFTLDWPPGRLQECPIL